MRLKEDGRWLPGAAKQITKINVIERKRQREGPERKERRPSPSELHRAGEGGAVRGLQRQFQNRVKVRVPMLHRAPERGFYSNKTRVLKNNKKEGRRSSETNSLVCAAWE